MSTFVSSSASNARQVLKWSNFGFKTGFRLSGDFDYSAMVRIVYEDDPGGGHGHD